MDEAASTFQILDIKETKWLFKVTVKKREPNQ